MNLNLPDKLYKLFVLLGTLGAVYCFNNLDVLQSKSVELIEEQNQINDTLKNNIDRLDKLGEELESKVKSYKKKMDETDSYQTFLSLDYQSKIEYNKISIKMDVIRKNVASNDVKYKNNMLSLGQLESKMQMNLIFAGIMGLIAMLGILAWSWAEEPKPTEARYPICQSCGEKFSIMKYYGSNSDQTLNYGFCNECFRDGQFTKQVTRVELLEILNQEYDNLPSKQKQRKIKKFLSLKRWATEDTISKKLSS